MSVEGVQSKNVFFLKQGGATGSLVSAYTLTTPAISWGGMNWLWIGAPLNDVGLLSADALFTSDIATANMF